jgi:hypothetical protein
MEHLAQAELIVPRNQSTWSEEELAGIYDGTQNVNDQHIKGGIHLTRCYP